MLRFWLLILFSTLASPAGARPLCHIHPPGAETKESEPGNVPFYNSLDECEVFNGKLFGGRGRCHCLPEGFFRSREFDFRFPQPDRFGAPQRMPTP
jgi:hypothetical protein